jgi:hypothetical protein
MPKPVRSRQNLIARPRHRKISIEPLEPRHLFAANALGSADSSEMVCGCCGCAPHSTSPRDSAIDTAEFMLGRVAVVPVLFESNGRIDANTENWTAQSIDSALSRVGEGVNWWSEALNRLGTVHTLEFVIDETFARNPVATGYEPISRTSQEHPLYVGAFMEAQGHGDAGSLENAVRQFNHQARLRLDTDWAFTIFIINSANDDDGQFASGSEFNVAFAYPGGLYAVIPSTRPASTIAHEVGHIFWARDEYAGAGSWTDRRGYYDAQNLNAANNPTPGFVQEPSIMRAGSGLFQSYTSYSLPASTRAMIGWQDSDGNGIFDVADVPLRLEGTGVYHAGAGIFSFTGYAAAVALPNRNSSGPQNDITLNRVDWIQYRLDGGAWQTATVIGKQSSAVRFDLAVDPFATIEIRAVDDRIGVTSPVFASDAFLPLLAGASLGGVAFISSGGEGEVTVNPAVLGGVTATLTRADGRPLRSGVIDPDQFLSRSTSPAADGVTLAALGHVLDGRVGSVAAPSSTGTSAFGFYNSQTASWQNRWAPDKKLLVTFDQPVGSVELDAIGLRTGLSYGRLEAYDAEGNLLTRVSTGGLQMGEVERMQVRDVAGRIASVQAFGHAWTEIGLDHLRYGVASQVTAGPDGVFRFAGLPDGQYALELSARRLIYAFPSSGDLVTISGGVGEIIAAQFERVRSPWNNPIDRFDVSGNSVVEPLDALLVLNDIARNGSRILSNPSQVTAFFDANDDGEITPLDALLVLNEIARRARVGAGGEARSEGPVEQPAAATEPAAIDAVFAFWSPQEEKEKIVGSWGDPVVGAGIGEGL